MHRIGAAGFLPVLISLAMTGAAEAQSPIPFSLDARVDAVIPVGDFADAANRGWGFSAGAALQVAPRLGLYGTYNRATFDRRGPAGGDFVDSGFSLGVSALLPGIAPAVHQWLGAGLLIHSLDERPATGMATTGETNLGFELGAGLAIEITPPIRFTPGLHFRRYSAPYAGQTGGAVSYLGLGAGINIYF